MLRTETIEPNRFITMAIKLPRFSNPLQKSLDTLKNVSEALFDSFKTLEVGTRSVDTLETDARIAFAWVMYDDTGNPYFALECLKICREKDQLPPPEVQEYFDSVVNDALAYGDLRKALDPRQKNAFDVYKKQRRNVDVVVQYITLVENGMTKAEARKRVSPNLDKPIGDRQLERITDKYEHLVNKRFPRLRS